MSLKVNLNKIIPLYKNYELTEIDENIGYYTVNDFGLQRYEEFLNKQKHEHFLKLLIENYSYFIKRKEIKKKAREKNERRRIKNMERQYRKNNLKGYTLK